MLLEDMAKHGVEFIMPSALGKMSFTMHPNKIKLNDRGDLDTRNISVDWYETKKLWLEDPEMRKAKKRIFHLNEHTDGYKIKFNWERPRVTKVRNQRMYKFSLARDLRKMPNELMKKGHKLQYNSCAFYGTK